MSDEYGRPSGAGGIPGESNMLAPAVIKHFPRWFIAMFALIYVSGYLIDFFYYASLGITDSGSEPLKLHYIQIGLVFLLGYVTLVALLVFTVFGASRMYSTIWADSRPASNTLTSILSIIYSLTIYIAAIFTPPQYFQINSNHFYEVLILIGVVTAAYLAIVIIIDPIHKSIELLITRVRTTANKKAIMVRRIHFIFESIRSCIVAGIIVWTIWFDYWIFRDLLDDLQDMFVHAGWTYTAFIVIFAILLFRIIKRFEEVHSVFGRIGIASLGFEILLMIYFLSIRLFIIHIQQSTIDKTIRT